MAYNFILENETMLVSGVEYNFRPSTIPPDNILPLNPQFDVNPAFAEQLGLTLNQITGVISGSPMEIDMEPVEYTFYYMSSDFERVECGSHRFGITQFPKQRTTIAFENPVATYQVGNKVCLPIKVTRSEHSIKWLDFKSGSPPLPKGLILDVQNMRISGTVSTLQPQTIYTFQAQDENDDIFETTLNLTLIDCKPDFYFGVPPPLERSIFTLYEGSGDFADARANPAPLLSVENKFTAKIDHPNVSVSVSDSSRGVLAFAGMKAEETAGVLTVTNTNSRGFVEQEYVVQVRNRSEWTRTNKRMFEYE